MDRAYRENPQPFRLGKLFALWYNKKNEPRIVVGPDVFFSFLELAIVHVIQGFVVLRAAKLENPFIFYVGLAILISHNVAFLATVMLNPGLPPRNPNIHSRSYLNRVKTVE